MLPESTEIQITIYNEANNQKENGPLGKQTINITDLELNTVKDIWLDLIPMREGKKSHGAGQVHFLVYKAGIVTEDIATTKLQSKAYNFFKEV